MSRFRSGALTALTTVCAMVLAVPGAEALTRTTRDAARMPALSDASPLDAMKNTQFGLSRHHDGTTDHLPGAQKNMDLVGELNLISPTTGNPVLPGQVADVAVHKGYAYLNSWDSPTCDDGGTFVVDIRDPANPTQVAFIPASAPYYHGEGAHVISVDTPQFTGDILAVNDETYGSNVALTDPTCAPADKTRRRLRPLRRHRPGEPGAARAGRRRPVAGGLRGPEPGRRAEVLPQRLHLAGRRAGLPRRVGQHRARGRRHLRHHRSDEPRVHQRPRPLRPARGRRHRRRRRARQRDLPPRRRGQAGRRSDAHARVLLGRRLRRARRRRPGERRRSSSTRTSTIPIR